MIINGSGVQYALPLESKTAYICHETGLPVRVHIIFCDPVS